MLSKITQTAILFILTLFCCLSAHALQIKEAQSDGEIDAFIASDELSRIKVIEDRIKSVKSNEGEVEIVEDTKLGEIYIRPIRNREPINIFITTEKNHVYKLLLLPKRMPSEQVFIKNTEDITGSLNTVTDNKEAVINIIKSMRDRKLSYSTGIFQGIEISFTNNTDEPIALSPEHFYYKGIVALSIDNELLSPGETTKIYIVTEVANG